jgi:hypothetical protein
MFFPVKFVIIILNWFLLSEYSAEEFK